MKENMLPAIKVTAVAIFLFSILYPLLLLGIAYFGPNNGKGKIIEYKGRKYYKSIGQSFTGNKYFWSRPSAVNYNANGSGGSNKGPSNKVYLAEIQARIDSFLVHNPGIDKSAIPVDLVTASGSGLDPHISVQAANVQVKRIARIRRFKESVLNKLIEKHTEKPLWGLFGPKKINVLELNIALDNL
ncbi:K+-transporting ATPase ATPase C chain [Pedobacter steynii]|uniref:Potassium-transporting ATPase KdpC subunit n=1 Tax=Pedobacter steynii TaxID=430522 RepID=A0A1H0C7E7_9SPHI|nr:K(+)-transporting ATPase subunit C [Pedobacter steynii]NQX41490.1 K(+)-transporting ATPase subunit C [Pedobacter steynii]SDN53814.1 K+-transporting ATPase ATPase C chain [Pedobacter steynii]